MLLGHARGKVGSLVFSRSNGKQIVRAKADVVKNPQTRAQVIQRIFLNTIAQAYSKMAAICDHSFEGIPTGQRSMSYFMHQNLKNLRQRVGEQVSAGYMDYEIFSFTPLGSNIFVPNNYEIAKGSLPTVSVVNANDDSKMAIALATNTYQGVLDAYGLQRGDQLTFVAMIGEDAQHIVFDFCRIILDPMDAVGNHLALDTPFISNGAVNMPNEKNEGGFNSAVVESEKLVFSFGSTYMFGSGVIVSRKAEDGTWQRSNASILANEDGEAVTYSLGYALDQFMEGAFTAQSSRYLNNAGTSPIIQQGAREVVPRIATASYNGVEIARDAELQGSADTTPHALTVGCENLADGVTYKIGLKAIGGTSVTNKTALTGTAATLNIAGVALSGNELVLLADDVVVDTYCKWVEE